MFPTTTRTGLSCDMYVERQHFVRVRHGGQEEAATHAAPAVANTLPEADFELFRFLFVVHLGIVWTNSPLTKWQPELVDLVL